MYLATAERVFFWQLLLLLEFPTIAIYEEMWKIDEAKRLGRTYGLLKGQTWRLKASLPSRPLTLLSRKQMPQSFATHKRHLERLSRHNVAFFLDLANDAAYLAYHDQVARDPSADAMPGDGSCRRLAFLQLALSTTTTSQDKTSSSKEPCKGDQVPSEVTMAACGWSLLLGLADGSPQARKSQLQFISGQGVEGGLHVCLLECDQAAIMVPHARPSAFLVLSRILGSSKTSGTSPPSDHLVARPLCRLQLPEALRDGHVQQLLPVRQLSFGLLATSCQDHHYVLAHYTDPSVSWLVDTRHGSMACLGDVVSQVQAVFMDDVTLMLLASDAQLLLYHLVFDGPKGTSGRRLMAVQPILRRRLWDHHHHHHHDDASTGLQSVRLLGRLQAWYLFLLGHTWLLLVPLDVTDAHIRSIPLLAFYRHPEGPPGTNTSTSTSTNTSIGIGKGTNMVRGERTAGNGGHGERKYNPNPTMDADTMVTSLSVMSIVDELVEMIFSWNGGVHYCRVSVSQLLALALSSAQRRSLSFQGQDSLSSRMDSIGLQDKESPPWKDQPLPLVSLLALPRGDRILQVEVVDPLVLCLTARGYLYVLSKHARRCLKRIRCWKARHVPFLGDSMTPPRQGPPHSRSLDVNTNMDNFTDANVQGRSSSNGTTPFFKVFLHQWILICSGDMLQILRLPALADRGLVSLAVPKTTEYGCTSSPFSSSSASVKRQQHKDKMRLRQETVDQVVEYREHEAQLAAHNQMARLLNGSASLGGLTEDEMLQYALLLSLN